MAHRRSLSLVSLALASSAAAQLPRPPQVAPDSDQDGLVDPLDSCPLVTYAPGFDGGTCASMDLDPSNDADPECKARERVAAALLNSGVFATHIAFAVVKQGELHFADAFEYIGGGQFVHDPGGIHRLHRIGSTSKALTAVAAMVLHEQGVLSLDDHVDDEDGTRVAVGGERQLRDLLAHRGAFRLDSGALHLFCYPGDLAAFWAEPDDLVSPHYDSATYGNLGGGFEYSAFNYSLAGAYLAHASALPFARLLQGRVFDAAGMCTATLDMTRAVGTPIGDGWATSQSSVMHVGPAINLFAPGDRLCIDNYYSSDDLYGGSYTWQLYRLDEASAQPRTRPAA